LNNTTHKIFFIPLVGIGLFVLSYIIAAIGYLGGSTVQPTSQYFHLLENYWCDLFGKTALNSQPNTVQELALIATSLLCASIAVFWYSLPKYFLPSPPIYKTIQYTGLISMFLALGVMTAFHDIAILVSSLFSGIALLLTFSQLFKYQYYKLLVFGLFSSVLSAMNFIVYYSEWGIAGLPLLQKITFIAFLTWFGMMSLLALRNGNIDLLKK